MSEDRDRLVCHRCGYVPRTESEGVCPKDGLHLIEEAEHRKAPRDVFLGTLLGGRYPVLGLVGSGGMGSVYRSVQPLVEREVAIKVVLPSTSFDVQEAKKRFLREAQAIAHLNHPGVVTLYDFGAEDDGTLFMVMELVQGQTLYKLYRNSGLTCRELCQIAVTVLDAMDTAHSLGIVHRDLKPENIMIQDEPRRSAQGPRVKVLDFGLAKLLGPSSASRLTRTGIISGTPNYMSPEQATGAPIGAGTDVYSFSALLYEGLAGRPPFVADHPMRLVAMRVVEDAPPIPALPFIPAGLTEIVGRGMERDPARRPTARQMADELRALSLGPETDQLLPPVGAAAANPPVQPEVQPVDAAALSQAQTEWTALAGTPKPSSRPIPSVPVTTEEQPEIEVAPADILDEDDSPTPAAGSSRRGGWHLTWPRVAAGSSLLALALAAVLLVLWQREGPHADHLPGKTERPASPSPSPAVGQSSADRGAGGASEAGARQRPGPDAPDPASGDGPAATEHPAGPTADDVATRPTVHLIESDPPGCDVFDAARHRVGATPLRLEVPSRPGEVARYRLTAPGYVAVDEALPLDGLEHRVRPALQPLRGAKSGAAEKGSPPVASPAAKPGPKAAAKPEPRPDSVGIPKTEF